MKILETHRLYFRPFTVNDFDLLYSIRGNSDIMKYIAPAKTKHEVTNELLVEIEHQKECGFSKFACFLKENDAFIGRAGFSVMENGEVEVGYGFLPEYWGKGYATETLEALLEWALLISIRQKSLPLLM